jgi:PAS domain S-box-containing protein
MRENRKLALALQYAAAIVVPLALGTIWPLFHPVVRGVPGYASILLIAITARFLGMWPAIIATSSFAGVLWFHVWPAIFSDRTLTFLLIRLGMFVVTALILASLSRQTAVAVRRMEKMYGSLVETSPDGIVVCNDAGEILYANRALARLLGAGNAQELAGRNLIDLASTDCRELMQQVIENRGTAVGGPATEMNWLTLDGQPLDVEMAEVSVDRGREEVLHIFVRDVSARRKLDEAARRMQALFLASIDAILWTDSSGRHVDANPAATELLGLTREEILTKRVGDFAIPAERDALLSMWRQAQSHRGERGEFTILRKDGETREIEYVAVADVLPGFSCAFLHDITGRKDAERSVQRLSARLLQLQDEERRRIARQLHDTTAQNLTAIRLNLVRLRPALAGSDPSSTEALEESIGLTEESIAEIRTLAYLLHPPMIEEAGLLATLPWYARGFESRSGIRVTLQLPEELSRLPLEVETAVFRIVQEALSNIQRHSGSAVASIRLERRPHALELQIADEGRGVPAHLRNDDRLLAASGVGIAGIRERIRELGGRMTIRSGDRGTTVNVTVPLPQD